jgi:hypothetical protein
VAGTLICGAKVIASTSIKTKALLFLKKKKQKDFFYFPPGALDFERLGTSINLLNQFLCWFMGVVPTKAPSGKL